MKQYKDDQVVTVGILKDVLDETIGNALRGGLQPLYDLYFGLDERVEGLEGRMDKLDYRMDRLDAHMDSLDTRMEEGFRKNAEHHDLFMKRIEDLTMEHRMHVAAHDRLEERTTELELATFG